MASVVVGHIRGGAAIAAAWLAGLGVQSVVGLPAPITGLVLLAGAVLASPSATDHVSPTADLAVRWLPLLFVPIAVGGASAFLERDALTLVLAVAVSGPVGFLVVVWVAR